MSRSLPFFPESVRLEAGSALNAASAPFERRRGPALVGFALAGMLAWPQGTALAGTGSCTGLGAISVSDARVGECLPDTGDSLTVTPSGSITGAGAPLSVGVRVNGGVTGVQIVNEGRIVGDSSDAIWNLGSIDRIVNRGLLQGGSAFALGLYSVGHITQIDNEASGVIAGAAGQPLALQSTGTLGTINNAGQILGGVQTNTTTINLLGTSARITGAVDNAGGAIRLLPGAVFTTENTFDAATFRILEGARMRIGASTHLITLSSGAADAFGNAGTLEVAEGVQANIGGNYGQSGVLRIGARDSTGFGRVSATGNVTLTQDARFEVDVSDFHTLAAGDTLVGVVTAGGVLSNAAPSRNVSDNSALFDFESGTNGSGVDLRLVAAQAGPQDGIVPAVVSNGLLNGVPTARVLDGYIRGGATGSDWDPVVTALGRLPTNSAVAQAVGQAMPLLHGNAARAFMAHTAGTGAAIEEQQSRAGLSAGAADGGLGLWVKPLGSRVDQDGRDGASGYEFGSHGLVGGVQSDLSAATTLGFGLGYLKSRVDGEGFAQSHRGDIESAQAIVYGRHTINDAGWQLSWQGDYTRSSIDSRRALGFIGRTAQAGYDGDAWHLGVGLSWPQAIGALRLRPMVAFDWRQFASDAYTEDGAGALNLQVNAQKAREAILKVGAQAQNDINERTLWLVRAALGYDLAQSPRALTARFTGGGLAFATEGLPPSRVVAELGLGLRHRLSERMDFSVRYDLRLRRGLSDQTASVRFAWMF